jgi:hypothetical protein
MLGRKVLMQEMTVFGIAKDVVLFLLAIWGAGLSTYSFRAARRKDKRLIHMRKTTVMLTYGSELGPPIAKLEAINIGQRTVSVSTLTFETPTKGRIFPLRTNRFPGLIDSDLPISLADGQSAQMHISYKEIGEALTVSGKSIRVKIVPICVDSTGGEHRGEPWEVDTNELMAIGRN